MIRTSPKLTQLKSRIICHLSYFFFIFPLNAIQFKDSIRQQNTLKKDNENDYGFYMINLQNQFFLKRV
jgi:hypothetical protein